MAKIFTILVLPVSFFICMAYPAESAPAKILGNAGDHNRGMKQMERYAAVSAKQIQASLWKQRPTIRQGKLNPGVNGVSEKNGNRLRFFFNCRWSWCRWINFSTSFSTSTGFTSSFHDHPEDFHYYHDDYDEYTDYHHNDYDEYTDYHHNDYDYLDNHDVIVHHHYDFDYPTADYPAYDFTDHYQDYSHEDFAAEDFSSSSSYDSFPDYDSSMY